MLTATARAVSAAHCLLDERLRFLDCDLPFLEHLGRDRDEVIGRHPLEFTHPLDREVSGELLDRLGQTGAAYSITKRYVQGGGGPIWITAAAAPVKQGAGPLRVSATTVPAEAPRARSALAQKVEVARRTWSAFAICKEPFGPDLISSPPAEILLQLYLAELEGACPTGAALAEASEISSDVAVRWLKVLRQRDLIEVGRDQPIAPTASFRITARCEEGIDALLGEACV